MPADLSVGCNAANEGFVWATKGWNFLDLFSARAGQNGLLMDHKASTKLFEPTTDGLLAQS